VIKCFDKFVQAHPVTDKFVQAHSYTSCHFGGVVSSIPNPILYLGVPVLHILCKLIGVTLSPKWDLRIKLFLLSRTYFLNRLLLSKVFT
jgi:hypothetical protein